MFQYVPVRLIKKQSKLFCNQEKNVIVFEETWTFRKAKQVLTFAGCLMKRFSGELDQRKPVSRTKTVCHVKPKARLCTYQFYIYFLYD